MGQKVWKVWKKVQKVWKKFRKVWIFQKFQTFRKLQKNDIQLELRKLRKTRFDSKTTSKVWLKVWNAGT